MFNWSWANSAYSVLVRIAIARTSRALGVLRSHNNRAFGDGNDV